MSGVDLKKKRKYPVWLITDVVIILVLFCLAVLGYKFRAERLNAERNTPEYPAISINATHLLEGVNK